MKLQYIKAFVGTVLALAAILPTNTCFDCNAELTGLGPITLLLVATASYLLLSVLYVLLRNAYVSGLLPNDIRATTDLQPSPYLRQRVVPARIPGRVPNS